MWCVRQNVALLEEEADINQLTEFFSYEHFYVIYCKFWELDTDHDLLIDAQDLARHNDHGERPRPRGRGRAGTRPSRDSAEGRCAGSWSLQRGHGCPTPPDPCPRGLHPHSRWTCWGTWEMGTHRGHAHVALGAPSGGRGPRSPAPGGSPSEPLSLPQLLPPPVSSVSLRRGGHPAVISGRIP